MSGQEQWDTRVRCLWCRRFTSAQIPLFEPYSFFHRRSSMRTRKSRRCDLLKGYDPHILRQCGDYLAKPPQYREKLPGWVKT